MVSDRTRGPDLSMRVVDSIGEGDDVDDPTTTIQGRCALAIDTPTPEIVRDLVGARST